MASNQQEDGFEFIRSMWGNMGFGLPGMVTPTMDVDELERRIKDLQAVEGWLKINLGTLQMTIQGLEVQRSTIAAVQAMSKAHAENEGNSPFANPALWAWPFNSGAQSAPQATPSEEPPTAGVSEAPAPEPKPKAAPKQSSRKP